MAVAVQQESMYRTLLAVTSMLDHFEGSGSTASGADSCNGRPSQHDLNASFTDVFNNLCAIHRPLQHVALHY